MSAAFDVVFGIFVAAMLALGVVAVRWAVRRDRVARAQRAEPSEPPGDATPDQSTPSGAPMAPGSAPKGSTS